MGLVKKIKKEIKSVVDPLGSLTDDMRDLHLNLQKQMIQNYMKEYESLSDKAIKKEFNRLKNRSGKEVEYRLMALNQIAVERNFRDIEDALNVLGSLKK